MRPASAARLFMGGLRGVWTGIEAYNSEPLPGRNAMSASPREIVRNNVKEKLARDEVVASITVRLARSIEIARIAKTAGFDSIYVDVEHSSLSLETTSQICIAALEIGVAPFVRVPSTRPEHVSRALDGGALGVIAPHIRSAEKARAVVPAAELVRMGARYVSTGPGLAFLLAASTARAKQMQKTALRCANAYSSNTRR